MGTPASDLSSNVSSSRKFVLLPPLSPALGKSPFMALVTLSAHFLLGREEIISAPEMGNNSCEGPLRLFSSLSPFACWNLMDSLTTVHCGQGHCVWSNLHLAMPLLPSTARCGRLALLVYASVWLSGSESLSHRPHYSCQAALGRWDADGVQGYFRSSGHSRVPRFSLGQPCIGWILALWHFVPILAIDSYIYSSLSGKCKGKHDKWAGSST